MLSEMMKNFFFLLKTLVFLLALAFWVGLGLDEAVVLGVFLGGLGGLAANCWTIFLPSSIVPESFRHFGRPLASKSMVKLKVLFDISKKLINYEINCAKNLFLRLRCIFCLFLCMKTKKNISMSHFVN